MLVIARSVSSIDFSGLRIISLQRGQRQNIISLAFIFSMAESEASARNIDGVRSRRYHGIRQEVAFTTALDPEKAKKRIWHKPVERS